MAGEVILKSFPFDSMDVLNTESGQMEGDRQYEAEIFRKYFAKFLSNGVYYGHYKNYGENSMKVTVDSGLNIKVAKGAGIIEGVDFENDTDKIFVLERPSADSRVDSVVVKMDSTLSARNTQLYVKQGEGATPATLQRDENVYEICIARVTVKSTTNITETDIKDTRLDKNLCGIVNSLISVDGEELYQQFRNYIDTVTDNLVRKDQDSVINGNITAKSVKDVNGKALSANDFTTAYKNKLDGIATGANNYTHPTSAGNKHIPSGGSSGQVLKWKANGEAQWGTDNNTTYSNATQTASGLMSYSDKKKLDGIASGATKNTNDFTDAYKTKLDGIATGATKNTVENVLTSTSTSNALSAAQGKALKLMIDGKQKNITTGTASPSGGSSGDIYLQYFA